MALHEGVVLVGDSKAPEGAVLAFSDVEFRDFIAGAKNGDFDHLLDE